MNKPAKPTPPSIRRYKIFGLGEVLIDDKCSCGSRQKSKCVKESGLGSGKMCVKELKE